eukprot:4382158-Amphidinium_carterae.1
MVEEWGKMTTLIFKYHFFDLFGILFFGVFLGVLMVVYLQGERFPFDKGLDMMQPANRAVESETTDQFLWGAAQ